MKKQLDEQKIGLGESQSRIRLIVLLLRVLSLSDVEVGGLK